MSGLDKFLNSTKSASTDRINDAKTSNSMLDNDYKNQISGFDASSNPTILDENPFQTPQKTDLPADYGGSLDGSSLNIFDEGNSNRWSNNTAFDIDGTYHFGMPSWGIDDYINERQAFIKSPYSFTNEPGWFYFKIFFKFNTAHGLFGNLFLHDKKENIKTYGTDAYTFLKNNRQRFSKTTQTFDYIGEYKSVTSQSKLDLNITALEEFAVRLNWIMQFEPWFFKGISGLQNSLYKVHTNLGKEGELEIQCMEDAVDMRLTHLFDLYRTAVYDKFNEKIVIPSNLRKFDMTVMLYHVPIRWMQTASILPSGRYPYKNLGRHSENAHQFVSRMSFRMFTFTGCEFDLESLGQATIPGTVINETPFSLGKGSFKIKYQRSFNHNMDEWNQFLFGDDAIYYSKKHSINADPLNIQSNRMNGIADALGKMYANPSTTHYKALVDATEFFMTDIHRAMTAEKPMGNLWEPKSGTIKEVAKSKLDSLRTGNSSLVNDVIGGLFTGKNGAKQYWDNTKQTFNMAAGEKSPTWNGVLKNGVSKYQRSSYDNLFNRDNFNLEGHENHGNAANNANGVYAKNDPENPLANQRIEQGIDTNKDNIISSEERADYNRRVMTGNKIADNANGVPYKSKNKKLVRVTDLFERNTEEMSKSVNGVYSNRNENPIYKNQLNELTRQEADNNNGVSKK